MKTSLTILCMAMCGVLGSPAPRACPADYTFTPLVLVSLDGFRSDYRDRGLTPRLDALAAEGVQASYLFPSYPTVTFPNHYTIATGMYPEAHGIIANSFYDPTFGDRFEVCNYNCLDGQWWGGEPIWNTVTRQGLLSAAYFWAGSDSDVNGKYPTYYYPYDGTVPFEDRVDQVLAWLDLPVDQRPAVILSYFNEPDHTGHDMGPDSPEVDMQLQYVDSVLGRLLDGLTNRSLDDCVNLMVLSDHGMAGVTNYPDNVIMLIDYIPDIFDLAYTFTGAFARIDPKDTSEEVEAAIMRNITCQRPDMRAYLRETLPTRHHFSNNLRIEDIVLDLSPGTAASISYDMDSLGYHGYDNLQKTMKTVFVARGPDFQKQLVVEPFHNIELYELMCELIGIECSPNNGTKGSLHHLILNPSTPPSLPTEPRPPTSQYPTGDVTSLLGMSGCPGDLTQPEAWLGALNLTQVEQDAAEQEHLPWGLPLSGDLPADLTILHHADHVTAYSQALKMPLWSSFTLMGGMPGTPVAQWSSDVRLQADTTATCASYESVAVQNITMYPLFPPVYSRDASLDRVPYLVSNAVPASPQLAGRWDQLVQDLIPAWLATMAPLNVIMGPVFDNNADSFPDDFTTFGVPEVSSDLFAVVTRCQDVGTSLNLCPADRLDAVAFTFPQMQAVTNCLEGEYYAQEYNAKVRDVELVTGLTFFPDLDFYARTALTLRFHPDMWQLQP